MATDFDAKTKILADLWLNFRDDGEFEDFIAYNDLGLPLAYMLSFELVTEISPNAEQMIEETFSLLLAGLGVDEDTGFESLDELLGLDEAEEEEEEFETYSEEPGEDEEFEEDDPGAEQAEKISHALGHAYQTGRADGIKEEQERVQAVCEQAVQVYLEAGKGQKAVFWREAANDLKPIDWDSIPEENLEDYGF